MRKDPEDQISLQSLDKKHSIFINPSQTVCTQSLPDKATCLLLCVTAAFKKMHYCYHDSLKILLHYAKLSYKTNKGYQRKNRSSKVT